MLSSLTFKNESSRHILTLMTGTTVGQAIPVACMPVLSRLYSPEDMGLFAIFYSISAILATLATARYELAIVQPEKDHEAAALLCLSAVITGVLSMVSLILVLLFGHSFATGLGHSDLYNWFFALPVTILASGICQACNGWHNRKKQYRRLAANRVTQGGASAGSQMALGFIHTGMAGLAGGFILGQCAAAALFCKWIWTDNRRLLKKIHLRHMLRQLSRYRRFPLFSAPGALMDSTALQMPVFIISRFYSVQNTGFFSLSFKALNLPLSLVASSVSQVFYQKIIALQKKKPEALFSYVLNTFFKLALLTIPLILITGFWGEELFVLVFGPQWASAGKMAPVLFLAAAIRFAVSPLSMVLVMEHNLKAGFFWQVLYFITLSVTLLTASSLSFDNFIWVFAGHECVLYSIYLFLILRGSRNMCTS